MVPRKKLLQGSRGTYCGQRLAMNFQLIYQFRRLRNLSCAWRKSINAVCSKLQLKFENRRTPSHSVNGARSLPPWSGRDDLERNNKSKCALNSTKFAEYGGMI